MEEVDNETFWNWINSLNPITIDVDENGEFVDETQLNQLTARIESEIKEIKGKDNGHS